MRTSSDQRSSARLKFFFVYIVLGYVNVIFWIFFCFNTNFVGDDLLPIVKELPWDMLYALASQLPLLVLEKLQITMGCSGVEALENQQRAHMALLEAKKIASQYQKEADKCSSGMETCEKAREKAEATTLEAQRKQTARAASSVLI
ncbi:hypothetical protein D8674_035777 [Pyrus ussuriensis x Pyrus communis]|uniref:Uncharacterized protein n=1 Tax=Pyrus ussuriensis x Pyrus communis TaxID=2448454 RepID=A0A5N5GI00_9ROSA|nr:hypothetical protein D8674_035777 [Pyrus ussuriensis x Pyrus communis]